MKMRISILVLLAFAVGVLAGEVFSRGRETGTTRVASPAGGAQPVARNLDDPPPMPAGLGEGERRDIDVFRRSSPSTVFINQVTVRRSLFSLDATRYQQGSGSGFVWDDDGHIVTNFHVIQTRDRTTEYVVKLWDHSEWEAKLIGIAPGKDLAVLKIDAPRDLLRPLSLGSSDNLAVGQKVLAVGNPFGLDQTLTVGIVSALGREIESPSGQTIRDVIQTDAAINPGNSGGPLLNSSGRLIGVNTAIRSPSGASAGIGFAIPADTVKRLVPQLIEYGEPIRPGIGINVYEDRIARSVGLRGVLVREVSPGMPAEQAGIQPVREDRRRRLAGDAIIAVDGARVDRISELVDAFEQAGGVGTKVELTLENAGRQRTVEVELVEINRPD